jgi:hypothetical protein
MLVVVPDFLSLKVVVFMVPACTASEKVALTLAPRRTPVALLAGLVPATLGDAVSIGGVGPVTFRVKVS